MVEVKSTPSVERTMHSIITDTLLDPIESHIDGKFYDSKSAYYRHVEESGHVIPCKGERFFERRKTLKREINNMIKANAAKLSEKAYYDIRDKRRKPVETNKEITKLFHKVK